MMRRGLRFSALVSGIALTMLTAGVAGAAQAPPPTAPSGRPSVPPPTGARVLEAGSTTNIGSFTDSQGTSVPVYATAGFVTRATPAQVAAQRGGYSANTVNPGATSCWQVQNYIVYGPSWAELMSYTQDIGWCGDGSTISSQGQNVNANVTGTGQVGFWQFAGVVASNVTPYYNNWAYQEYTEGHFHQCPIIQFACADDKYPTLTTNVYADGSSDLYSSS